MPATVTVNKLTAAVAALLLLSIGFAAGFLVGRGQVVPTGADGAADARAAHAVDRLRAALRNPNTLHVLAVTANKTAVPEDVMVEVDFLADGADGQASGKFWVLWQSGRPALSGYSSWHPGEEPGQGDRAGLFKASK